MVQRKKLPPEFAGKISPGNVDNVDWLVTFPASYEATSRNARHLRYAAREEARERRKRRPAPQLTPDQEAFRAHMVERNKSRAASIDARWRYGHVWVGGAVGGNSMYSRSAQVYRGLVSDEHPIYQLFVSKLPRAASLLSGATKAYVSSGDSKLLSLDEAYVGANSRMRGILRVELDIVFPGGFLDIEAACRTANLPPPNIVVGYVDRRGALWHPHLLWLLEQSVTFCGRGKRANQALWHKVLRGLTFALVAAGADPGGLSNPMRTKNALCPVWNRTVLSERPFSLDKLKAHVRMNVSDVEFSEAVAARDQGRLATSDPIPDPMSGSNNLFIALSDWARENIAARRLIGTHVDEWRCELVTLALALADRGGRSESHARATALRVADYMWNKPVRQPLSAEECARRLREAAHGTHRIRRNQTESQVVSAYLDILKQQGVAPTQITVAAAIGKTRKTVRVYWQAALAAAESELGNMPSSVKKSVGASAIADATTRNSPSTRENDSTTTHPKPSTPRPRIPAFLVVGNSRCPPTPSFLDSGYPKTCSQMAGQSSASQHSDPNDLGC